MMQPLTDVTILIAEDERPVRMLLRVVLESAGARVLEAEHGAVAVRLLELHPEVAVLCTDLHMPTMDGAALVDYARTHRPGLPIVACTAMDLEQVFPDVARVVDATVQKPFVPTDLIRAVDLVRRRGDAAQLGAAAAT